MQVKANSPEDYIRKIPEERQATMQKLRQVISDHLPPGFTETMNYGMIGYVVPHSVYPDGYHCDPKQPLPFMNIASQKNYISVYHMGLYEGPLLDWFKTEYPKHTGARLDMGKCCIRFKKPEQIPFELIGTLAGKVTTEEWIRIYESQIKKQ
ncbi:MAG: DUF1801 domain-containing protein [Flavobacteriales bacterium]|nr:DUF1801 domain-containing protein [Flavobacteriales bacterium]